MRAPCDKSHVTSERKRLVAGAIDSMQHVHRRPKSLIKIHFVRLMCFSLLFSLEFRNLFDARISFIVYFPSVRFLVVFFLHFSLPYTFCRCFLLFRYRREYSAKDCVSTNASIPLCWQNSNNESRPGCPCISYIGSDIIQGNSTVLCCYNRKQLFPYATK